ncbi:MAG: septation protein IspZ [Marinovum sp.]|nr:septation protein IspZ [Marinovum sp.]MBT6506674.1 septation protein IspZ [Marinovum sp.]MDG2231107.1 septation protein IspZ [Paracoccaceae bacterium]
MSDKNASPLVTSILEIGPVVVFFAVFIWRKGETVILNGVEYSNFIQATAVFVPLMIFATFLAWLVNGRVSKMQLLTLIMVTVFGALTIFLNDERFIKMKPTLIYLLFGGVLTFGHLRGKNYLGYLMGERSPIRDEGWAIISRRVTIFFFALAFLNEAIWRTQTNEVWVYFKTFGLTAALFIFMVFQYPVLKKYGDFED